VRNNPQDTKSRDRLAELRILRSASPHDQGPDEQTGPGAAAARRQVEDISGGPPDEERR
jgi:hypothetical protein